MPGVPSQARRAEDNNFALCRRSFPPSPRGDASHANAEKGERRWLGGGAVGSNNPAPDIAYDLSITFSEIVRILCGLPSEATMIDFLIVRD
jgi:hypothetical protein